MHSKAEPLGGTYCSPVGGLMIHDSRVQHCTRVARVEMAAGYLVSNVVVPHPQGFARRVPNASARRGTFGAARLDPARVDSTHLVSVRLVASTPITASPFARGPEGLGYRPNPRGWPGAALA